MRPSVERRAAHHTFGVLHQFPFEHGGALRFVEDLTLPDGHPLEGGNPIAGGTHAGNIQISGQVLPARYVNDLRLAIWLNLYRNRSAAFFFRHETKQHCSRGYANHRG
ncbi:hypothetical protein ADT71_23945 [Novosphingobium sp. ST904]|nr:hypothetical protein ADT71_23945 [Novosphingobium sp. ST904]